MGCAAIDLSRWKDFPKGLRVLLLEESAHSAAKVSSKLESMDYVVSTFLDEDEALAAVFSDGNSFHVAIVEVKAVNRHGCFKFLEAVQGLPTIMISDVNCLSTMMKCIALGAAEFLQKPLSEDKLKNIWQHVVHKAFNAGESALSKSLKPIKAAAVSILQMEQNVADSNSYSDGLKSGSSALPWEACLVEHENGIDPSLTSDNFADPSIPELQKGACDLDDCHIQDRHNWSAHDERADDGEPHEPKNLSCVNSKSVDITCNSSVCELASCMENATPRLDSVENNEEVNSACDAKLDRKPATVNSQDQDNVEKKTGDPDNKKRALNNASNAKASKKKTKFDWTPELHRRFVQAVEQLGIDQAIPSKILELMKVEGLTRHNVASHLQKYRMHRRHTMHKVDEAATRRTWHHHRQSTQRVLSTNRPIMAFPPPQPNCSIPTPSFYPVWGHPPSQPWSAHTGFPPIYPPEKWVWVRHADAWGCPVVPVQTPPTSYFTQNKTSSLYIEENDDEESWMNFLDLCPAEEEVIDRAVKEAISKPWLPLPLGLKPPSVDSVLSELHRHGVSRIPPFNS